MSRPDVEAMAAEVVLLMKSALAPVVQRIELLEKRVIEDMKMSEYHDDALKTLFQGDCIAINQEVNRVAERLSSIESRTPTRELWDAMTADAVANRERLKSFETALADLPVLRDRVVCVETKAAQPLPVADLGDVPARLSAAELKLEFKAQTVDAIVGTLAEHTKDLSAMRERLAVLETRPQLQGEKGDPGDPGKDGTDGAPGAPGLAYQGVYQDGKSYEVGHVVTWAGSTWHANEPTTAKPGEGSKSWTLMVKRGRDGRDGRDALDPVPVVRVGR